MSLDQTANFVRVVVQFGYGTTDTVIELATGMGALLPDPADGEYNLVWWDATDYRDPSDDPNVEIVRVTGLNGDEITILRAQEGTVASPKFNTGKIYKMLLGITKKMIDDISALADQTPVDNEIVSGAGTSWTLANTPIAGSVTLYGGGIRLIPGDGQDYTISGKNITTVNSFGAGSLVADYRM